jgi:hypothetical protein
LYLLLLLSWVALLRNWHRKSIHIGGIMMLKSQRKIGVLTFAALGALLLAGAGTKAAIVTVTPSNMQGWNITSFDSGGNVVGPSSGYAGTFVQGPASPPLGTGSLQLTTAADGGGAVQVQTASFDGLKLSTLTSLSYSTFVTQNSGGADLDNEQAPYFIVGVSKTGNGVQDGFLVFEPTYQTGTYATMPGVTPSDVPDQRGADGAAPKIGIWENYNVLEGGFWTDGHPGGPPLDTLAHYISNNPDATIADFDSSDLGIEVAAGAGGPSDWGNFIGNVDDISLGTAGGTTTYDFEASVPEPASLTLLSVSALALLNRRRRA